jgi:glutathionyl-hydroquinone reductase
MFVTRLITHPLSRLSIMAENTQKISLTWANTKTGEFQRQISSFRDWISRQPGSKYPAEPGRYHLYVS